MAGLLVFKSLPDALRAGYQVYDRTSEGYIVRQRFGNRWAMAIVSFAGRSTLPQVDHAQLDRAAAR